MSRKVLWDFMQGELARRDHVVGELGRAGLWDPDPEEGPQGRAGLWSWITWQCFQLHWCVPM